MFKRITTVLCAFVLCFVFCVTAGAETAADTDTNTGSESVADTVTVTCSVSADLENDFMFSLVGRPIKLTCKVENGEGLKARFKYAEESTEYEEGLGFKWKDVKSEDGVTATFVPETSGIFCFAAEVTDPQTKQTVSSLETVWCTVLVIDPAEKVTVTTEEELMEALKGRTRYILIDGDISFDNAGTVKVDQQFVVEINEGSTLTLTETQLYLAEGNWKVGGTLIVDGTLCVGYNSSVSSSDNGAQIFMCGNIMGMGIAESDKLKVTECNVSPLDPFNSKSLYDAVTGITAYWDKITNYNIFDVEMISENDSKYIALNSRNEGEVLEVFRPILTGCDGEYTVSVPINEKYAGQKLVVYTVDLSVSGTVTPTETVIKKSGSEVRLTVDNNTLVMVKTVPKLLSDSAVTVIIIGAMAVVVMVMLTVIPLITKAYKKKKQKAEETPWES